MLFHYWQACLDGEIPKVKAKSRGTKQSLESDFLNFVSQAGMIDRLTQYSIPGTESMTDSLKMFIKKYVN